jgi:hypothetical protein
VFFRQFTVSILAGIAVASCSKGGASDPALKVSPGEVDPATISKEENGKHSLIGLWDFDVSGTRSATYEFKPDGTATITAVSDAGNKTTVTIKIDETYNLKGSQLDMMATHYVMSTDDASNKDEVEKQNEETNVAIKDVPHQSGPVTWQDNDHVTLDLTTAATSDSPAETKKVKLVRHGAESIGN